MLRRFEENREIVPRGRELGGSVLLDPGTLVISLTLSAACASGLFDELHDGGEIASAHVVLLDRCVLSGVLGRVIPAATHDLDHDRDVVTAGVRLRYRAELGRCGRVVGLDTNGNVVRRGGRLCDCRRTAGGWSWLGVAEI